jgi:Tol biopolymer transport system component
VRDLDGADGPRFSPDGRRIAVSSLEQGHADIRVLDMRLGTLARLSFDGTNIQPEWSPDGTRISYASTTGNRAYGLYWTRADGSGRAEALLSPGDPMTEGVWSPDGRALVYRVNDPVSLFDLMVLPLDSPRTPRPYLRSLFYEYQPAVSPDGRWLTYVSNESGPNEVYVRAFPEPSGVWQVSAGGGTEPRWAPGGRELFYRVNDSLVSVAVTTQPTFSVGARRTLWARPYVTGVNHAGYDVHPDGERFVMVKSLTERPTLIVSLNFFDELRRRSR